MATEKILNTRIALKIDSLENWNKSTLGLKKGELAIATVAATAGTGLTEPVCMLKIGEDGVKTFGQLEWNFYAKASDVLSACKSEAGLTTFINNVIAGADMATNEKFTELAGRVDALEGDENADGSVAKAIKDAIDALDLANTYVAQEDGKSLMTDAEHTKLDGISEGANKVENVGGGKIKIDGTEVTVYEHPVTHTVSEISDFEEKVKAYDYATKAEAQGYANAKDEDIAAAKKAGDDAKAAADAKVASVAAGDASVTVAGTTTAPTVAVKLDPSADNAIKLNENGLKVEIGAAPEYTIVKAADAGDYAAVYNLTKDGTIVGASINIPKDIVVKSGSVVGDEIVLVLNDEAATEIKIPVASLIEYVTSGSATGDMVVVNVSDDHKVTATITDGTITLAKLATDVQTAIGKAHDHENADVIAGIDANKVAAWDASEQNAKDYADDQIEALGLGTMSKEAAADYVKKSEATGYNDILTKTEAQGAYQAKGEYYTKTEADAEFTNATEVDGQIDAKITALDLANTYQAKGEYATAEQGGKADTAIQSVTSVAGNGIKTTINGTAVTIDWDSEVTLVFDCGNSGVTA